MTREELIQHFENDPARKEFAEALRTGAITGDVDDDVLELQERLRKP